MFRRAERRQLAALTTIGARSAGPCGFSPGPGASWSRPGPRARRVRRHRGRRRVGPLHDRGREAQGAHRSPHRGPGRAARGELRLPSALHAAPARRPSPSAASRRSGPCSRRSRLRHERTAPAAALPAEAPTGFVPRRWRPFVLGMAADRPPLLGALRHGRAQERAPRRRRLGRGRPPYRSLDDDLLLGRPDRRPAAAGCRLTRRRDASSRPPAAARRGAGRGRAAGRGRDRCPTPASGTGGWSWPRSRRARPRRSCAHELLYGLLPRDPDHRPARGGRPLDRLHRRLHAPEDRAAAGEKRTLLTAVLADGINMGLSAWPRPAGAPASGSSPGSSTGTSARTPTSRRPRAWSTRSARCRWPRCGATARMSSSDGQFFQAGGHGAAPVRGQRPVRQRAGRQLLQPPLRPVRRLLQQGHRGDGARGAAHPRRPPPARDRPEDRAARRRHRRLHRNRLRACAPCWASASSRGSATCRTTRLYVLGDPGPGRRSRR